MSVIKIAPLASPIKNNKFFLGSIGLVCLATISLIVAIGIPSSKVDELAQTRQTSNINEADSAWVSDSNGGFLYVVDQDSENSAVSRQAPSSDDQNTATYRVAYGQPVVTKVDGNNYSVEVNRVAVDSESLPQDIVPLDNNDGAISATEIADGLVIPLDSVEIAIPKGKEVESITVIPAPPIGMSGEYMLPDVIKAKGDVDILPSVPAGDVSYIVRDDGNIESIDLYPVDYAPQEGIISYRPFVDIKVSFRDITYVSYATNMDAIKESRESTLTGMAFMHNFRNRQNVKYESIDSGDVAKDKADHVSPTIQTRTGQAIPAEYYNGIEVTPGSRALNGVGEFRYRNTEIKFIPRGGNYAKLRTSTCGAYRSEHHATFHVGDYNQNVVESALSAMQSDGYNTVRVFIDPGHWQRADCGELNGIAGAYSDTTLYAPYMNNVADFVNRAYAHGIYVDPVLTEIPVNRGYHGTVIDNQNLVGWNALYMNETSIRAKAKYVNDFIVALRSRIGTAKMRAILAYDFENEVTFYTHYKPFSLSSGTVSTAKGSYNMSDTASRQAAADDNLVYWADVLTQAVKQVDPYAMTTAGFFSYKSVRKEGPNGLWPPTTSDAWPISWHPGRPSKLTNYSSIDFVSIHFYTDARGQLLNFTNAIEWPNVHGPIIIGEIGAFKDLHTGIVDAANAIRELQIDSCQNFHAAGWLFWTYDGLYGTSDPLCYTLIDNNGAINGVFAPVARPDPCSNSSSSSYTLTVTKSGAGSGTVTGNQPPTINCGATCSASYASGTSVTLTASAASGSTFAGWSGEGCSGISTCTVTISAARNVTATFSVTPTQNYTLTVTKAGTGTGTVTSNPAGINCGTDCSESYNSGTSVTLTASAASGSTFAGWSGEGCSGTSTCTVTMSAARNVTATFNPQYVLNVTKNDNGAGTVAGGGINCGSTCNKSYSSGTSVTLTASASAGKSFAGWGGACTGTGSCSVTMNAARNVSATFNPLPSGVSLGEAVDATSLAWTAGGNASWFGQTAVSYNGSDAAQSGLISHDQNSYMQTTITGPGTISYWWKVSSESNYDYLRFYIDGTEQAGKISGDVNWQQKSFSIAAGSHTLKWAYAKDGSVSSGSDAGWVDKVVFTSGGGTTYALTVNKTGTGTVTSTPAGINCGSTCSYSYSSGNVTLTAVPGSGKIFAGWSGDCSGTGTCTVTMNAAKTVTATFHANIALNKTATSSGQITGNEASKAVDGNSDTAWNSGGGATQWIKIDLGDLYSISKIEMVPAYYTGSASTGPATNEIYAGTCGSENWQATLTQTITDGVAITYPATGVLNLQNVRCVKIKTTSSNSWVAWREIRVQGVKPSGQYSLHGSEEYSLQVSKNGAGRGTVTSDSGDINCGKTCEYSYDQDSTVSLTATPVSGSVFSGWSGACTGTETCDVSMTSDNAVTATFALQRYPLVLSVSGSGKVSYPSGSITRSACGIACSDGGKRYYIPGKKLELKAIPKKGYQFARWDGVACKKAACSFAMPSNGLKVSAIFEKKKK